MLTYFLPFTAKPSIIRTIKELAGTSMPPKETASSSTSSLSPTPTTESSSQSSTFISSTVSATNSRDPSSATSSSFTSTPTESPTNQSQGLSPGVKIGIGVGAGVGGLGLIIAGVATWLLLRNRKKNKSKVDPPPVYEKATDDPIYEIHSTPIYEARYSGAIHELSA